MSLNRQPKKLMPGARQGELQQKRPASLNEHAGFEPYFSVTSCRPRLLHPFAGRIQSGFTLVELMVVIAVLAILATIATPGFQGIVAQNRATSAANELQTTLQVARSAAIAQSRPVTVCPANFASTPPACANNTNWHGGWIVLLNGQVLRERRALGPAVTLAGEPQLIFSSTGTLAGQALTPFDLQVTSGPGASRVISMSLGGSSKVTRGD